MSYMFSDHFTSALSAIVNIGQRGKTADPRRRTNVGSPSTMLDQRETNIDSTSCVCWEVTFCLSADYSLLVEVVTSSLESSF